VSQERKPRAAAAPAPATVAPAPAVAAPAAMNLLEMVQYAPGAIVSRTLAEAPSGTLTLFAFDQGQGLSEHSAPFDAHVLVLEGQVRLKIGGKDVAASAGQLVTMPANVPHSVSAAGPFKMLLIMFKA
jgi:quercetin dioxygenase-like cupin family protein